MNTTQAINGLMEYSTEQLYAAYMQIKNAKPQLHEHRRAALAILEEIEKRGIAVDKYVEKLSAVQPVLNGGCTSGK